MALTQTPEDGLKISNAGTNGQYLQKQSGNTGGLTWADATSTTINNNANDRLITGSASANTLEAEAKLLFINQEYLRIDGAEGANAILQLTADEGDDNADSWRVQSLAAGGLDFSDYSAGSWTQRVLIDSSGNVGIGTSPSHLVHIKKDTGSGATGTKVVIENPNTNSVNNKAELYLKTARGDFGFLHYNATESYIQVPDQLIINTNNATSATQALHIDTSQNVKVSNGNLVIGTSGKGIDFSATAGSGDSEVFTDFERGTWTPTLKASSTDPTTSDVSVTGHYVKIDRLVHVQCYFSRFDIDNVGSGTARIGGLPFNVGNLGYTPFGQATHTNDKFASSQIPWAVYGRTQTDMLQLIEQNGSQISYSVSDGYYLGISIQYITDS